MVHFFEIILILLRVPDTLKQVYIKKKSEKKDWILENKETAKLSQNNIAVNEGVSFKLVSGRWSLERVPAVSLVFISWIWNGRTIDWTIVTAVAAGTAIAAATAAACTADSAAATRGRVWRDVLQTLAL